MRNKIAITGASTLLMATPFLAFAQDFTVIQGLVKQIGDVINALIPITLALALLFFIWGLAVYILNSDSDEAKKKATRKIVGGLIALFVIVSIWGLVAFLQRSLGVSGEKTGEAPKVKLQ